jgi:hypothetical protein
MKLVTSIPPAMSRLNDGREIGSEYQLACIHSWIASGFEPISLNAAGEDLPVAAVPLVRSVHIERDARSITDKPQVFFSDLLHCAVRESRCEPFVITNADMLLGSIGDVVSRLTLGECLVCRRVDVDHPDQRTGTIWFSGYDLFAAHAVDAVNLKPSQLVFGSPWWDHYFPLAMLGTGCRLKQRTEPVAFHLKHERKWGWDIWETLGNTFLAEIAHYPLPGAYSRAIAPQSWLRGIIRRRTTQRPLDRVAAANVAFVDAHSQFI